MSSLLWSLLSAASSVSCSLLTLIFPSSFLPSVSPASLSVPSLLSSVLFVFRFSLSLVPLSFLSFVAYVLLSSLLPLSLPSVLLPSLILSVPSFPLSSSVLPLLVLRCLSLCSLVPLLFVLLSFVLMFFLFA
jgi:hypothetical protein